MRRSYGCSQAILGVGALYEEPLGTEYCLLVTYESLIRSGLAH
jgi:hypothetical protein